MRNSRYKKIRVIQAKVLDLDNPLPADNCELLIEAIPQVLGSGLENYNGDEDRLTKIESELLKIIKVPRVIPRLNMMLFISQIDEAHTLAAAEVGTLARASAQVKSSSHLRSVLSAALAVGNYLNTGDENPEDSVRGITIDSVLKFKQYKMNDAFNALHTVTQQLTDKEPQFAQKMREELKDVEAMTAGSPALNIRSTCIIDTSYFHFALVFGCIDADLCN